VKIVILA